MELPRRLASLVPPPKLEFIRFHGVFAPGAKVRPLPLPRAQAEPGPEQESLSLAARVEEPKQVMRPRIDGAGLLHRTFSVDVCCCPKCGGRRRVLAYLTARQGVRVILEHLGRPSQPPRLAPAREMPRFLFFKSASERKPSYLDLESPHSVENFLRMLQGAQGVSVSEMLPALEQTWLPDAQGHTYTSEFRIIAVDPEPWRPD